MAGFTVSNANRIHAGAPGVAMVGANFRVKSQLGFLGTQADVLSFSNGAVGQWLAPNQRTRVQGAFIVSQSSQGTATMPNGAVVPVLVVAPDTRIRSL